MERIANSIKEFGFFEHRAVAIDSEDNVVEGHGRILAARKAGLTQVPTICLDDMTEEQIKAWRLIENKTAESSYDEAMISKEIEELLQSDIDMEAFGFSVDILEDETIEVEPDVPFTEILNEENNYIVLKFNNKIDWLNAMGMFGIEKAKAYPTRKEGNKKQIDKTYDKIFDICDKYSTLFKVETEKEYNTNECYVLEMKSVPPEAEEEIIKIKNVEIRR